MSANNIERHCAGGYNFYTVGTDTERLIIGGVPERFSAEYVSAAASCDAAVLLTSKPEFVGGLAELLSVKPNIGIYGGSACLRNIKEILNRPINERLVKDNMILDGIKLMVTPNLHWVDSIMALYNGVLFSGEAFSDAGGGLEEYYRANIAVNRPYVKTAVERLEKEAVSQILPARGAAQPSAVLARYAEWSAAEKRDGRKAVVIYSSRYGYTRALAERAAAELEKDCVTELYDAARVSADTAAAAVNSADILLVGTNTIDRNAPRPIWDIITRTDLVGKRGMPFFVFGSFGWAADGLKLVDKTLAAMGLHRAAKPVEVLFKPSEADFGQIEKSVRELIDYCGWELNSNR